MSPTSGKLEPNSDLKTARSVLLCGASVRSLAESAIAAGFRPLCVDFFEDEDLKNLLDAGRGRFVARIDSFHQLPERIRSVRSSIPLLWAGGLENHSAILGEIGRHRPVIGPGIDAVELVRNPWMLRNWTGESAIGCPRLARQATADTECHWLRKAVRSSGGLGIGEATTHTSGEHAVMSRDDYLQEYIDGVPMSALMVADADGVRLFGTSLQLIGWPSLGASGFLFCGNLGPVDAGDKVSSQLLEAGSIIVDRSGLRGVFGIDFILRQGRAWLIEVNPRITASHMLYELQQPGLITQRHLAAFGWKAVRLQRRQKRSSSTVTARSSQVTARLILWSREDIRWSGKFDLPHDAEVLIADYPQPGTKIPAVSPVCSILIRADNVECVPQQLTVLQRRSVKHGNSFFRKLHEWGYSMPLIADQLALLLQKFSVSR